MIDSKYKWQLIPPATDRDAIQKIADALSLDPTIVEILFQRGYRTQTAIQQFLTPDPDHLADPFLMHDMQRGVKRITTAIENDEQIVIYGDYDADGLTSTAIMYETLSELGANVSYYIPNRFTDGYGPNVKAFQQLIDDGTTLIITVDTGITGFDAVDFANQHACDVIITDHHEIATQGMPDAYAIIHARYPGAEYPFGDFSGAGVAFKVATALLDELPQETLDLVTIGTVADLVSLTGENRILTKFGFQAIQKTIRTGLVKLMALADLTNKPVDEHMIGFGIAPRLNALGRMGDASLGVALLTTLDDAEATKLAEQTETLNQNRRHLVTDIFKAACEQVEQDKHPDRKTIMVAQVGWHEGVLGIVASRLVDKYHQPAVALTIDPKTGIAKGSGRSVKGFDLFKALTAAQDLMLKFGGHAMAVGLSLSQPKIKAVAAILERQFQMNADQLAKQPRLLIDAQLRVDQVDRTFYDTLSQMAPYGTDNPEPLFLIKPATVSNLQTMGNRQNHLRFMIAGKQRKLNVVAFNQAELMAPLQSAPTEVQLVGSIELNVWQQRTNLQLLVRDYKVTGSEILDQRTKQLNQRMFTVTGTYICFNRNLLDPLKPYINEKSHLIWYNDVSEALDDSTVIIVDCPETLAELQQVARYIGTQQIILYLFKQRFVYETGMPTRTQFGHLFKLLTEIAPFNIKHELDAITVKLGLQRELVIFMIQVFQELQFVAIQDGVLTMNNHPQKQKLIDAEIYKQRQVELAVEQQLLLPNSTDLMQQFNRFIKLAE